MAKPKDPDFTKNLLFYGDNLDVLRQWIKDETIDLIYLDPPFNSNRSYNVLFKQTSGAEAAAQITAFDDTWTWGQDDEEVYADLLARAPGNVPDVISALLKILGPSDVMAYLVMMCVRLVELRRVLKPTGSVYLHCDQTASHYIKVLLDGVFGVDNFLNNVVWLYGLGGSSKRYWPRKHDDILWYSRERDQQYFDADKVPATSNRMKGELKKAPDYWDIPAINNQAKERLGYPTQKPLALLDRIVRSSCPERGVVLDPFCGCGTTVDAAHRLGRRWLGIDISYLAVDLIEKRLIDTYGAEVRSTFEIVGVPRDVEGALALFRRSPFDFERWAVSLVDGQPNMKQVGDRGVDGVIRFPAAHDGSSGKIVVSVKGGSINPGYVRDLSGTVSAERAEMGLLVTNQSPTGKMIQAAQQAGSYHHPLTGRTYPRVQIRTVAELLAGDRPLMPSAYLPYIKADKYVPDHPTLPGF